MSDVSSTSSDGQSDGVTLATQGRDQKPNFAYNAPSAAQAEVSKANADKRSVELVKETSASASDQLTKLAQIVHEHYKSYEEGEQGETHLTNVETGQWYS